MANRIVEGVWDCPYCKTTAIGGLTKHCPCCGHPQDADIQFYMGEEKKYLEAELAQEYGQGADWVCGYCGALNRVHFKYCATCGGAKETSEKDYFQAKEHQAQRAAQKAPAPQPAPKRKSKLPLILAVIVIALAFFLWPRSMNGQVTDKAWTRGIDIQVERTVSESDWSVPQGGRVQKEQQEIHHYNNVLDHYETKTRQVPEQVFDGYDSSYSNNGDGTFTEIQTPRYRTEYRTETYQSPVYVQVPEYKTKYYYEIERWQYDRTVTASGGADEPKWPAPALGKKERTDARHERYLVKVSDGKKTEYTLEVSLERWQSLKIGDEAKLTIVGGSVTEINGKPLR